MVYAGETLQNGNFGLKAFNQLCDIYTDLSPRLGTSPRSVLIYSCGGSVSKYQVGSGHLHHWQQEKENKIKSQLILIGRFGRVAEHKIQPTNIPFIRIRHRKEELLRLQQQCMDEAGSPNRDWKSKVNFCLTHLRFKQTHWTCERVASRHQIGLLNFEIFAQNLSVIGDYYYVLDNYSGTEGR